MDCFLYDMDLRHEKGDVKNMGNYPGLNCKSKNH